MSVIHSNEWFKECFLGIEISEKLRRVVYLLCIQHNLRKVEDVRYMVRILREELGVS
jgi:hypothetical protein